MDGFHASSELGNVTIALKAQLSYACSTFDRYVVEEDKVHYVHACCHDQLTKLADADVRSMSSRIDISILLPNEV